jgi:2',3'-cyclic-nucleotide 2'-phosphodiesterase (5'-nucleotidase family)
MSTLTILHTNDFHNHLRPEQASRLAQLRRSLGSSGLLLDAGDAISAGNLTYRPGGEEILDRMSEAGYEAMAVGNREFHFTEAGFQAKVSRARFPVLCANVRTRGPAKLPVIPSARFVLCGEVRAGVFGLTVPMITERMLARNVSSYVFDDPIAVATEVVPTLRSASDLVICLSHIGLARDRELAAAVRGIDLIVGGHTHAKLAEGEWIGETLIVQAGWWAHYYGEVTIDLEEGAKRASAKIHTL